MFNKKNTETIMSQKNKQSKSKKQYADNFYYPFVNPNITYGFYKTSEGDIRKSKFIKLSFQRKDIYHAENSKSVVCKLKCYLSFNVPDFMVTEMMKFTSFEVTGVAICSDDDTFDLNKGKLIASAKAENEAYRVARNMLKTMLQQYENFLIGVRSQLDMFESFSKHNNDFIERVVAE